MAPVKEKHLVKKNLLALLIFCLAFQACDLFSTGGDLASLSYEEKQLKKQDMAMSYLLSQNENKVFGSFQKDQYKVLDKEKIDFLYQNAYPCKRLGVCTEIFVTAIMDSKNKKIQHTLYRSSNDFRKGNIKERSKLKVQATIDLKQYVEKYSKKLFKGSLRYSQVKLPEQLEKGILKLRFELGNIDFSNPIYINGFSEKEEELTFNIRMSEDQFKELKERYSKSRFFFKVLIKPINFTKRQNFTKDFFKGNFMGTRKYSGAIINVELIHFKFYMNNLFTLEETLITSMGMDKFPTNRIFPAKVIFPKLLK